MRALAVTVVALSVIVIAFAAGPAGAQDGAEATIAALQTRVAELEGTVAARGDKINAQRTQIAELKGEGEEDAPKRGERCEDVADNAVQWIIDGLNPDLGITLNGVQAVRSNDYEKVWFVAADVDGPGLEGIDDIAVWATNGIGEEVGVSDGALILSVNDLAVQVNGYWFHGPDTDAQISLDDDGVSASIECTQAVLAT